jgi:hypothetical protein
MYFIGVHLTGGHLTGGHLTGGHLTGGHLTGVSASLIAEIINSRSYLPRVIPCDVYIDAWKTSFHRLQAPGFCRTREKLHGAQKVEGGTLVTFKLI